jgi:ABC-type bacteriocin/lantibiotic exporter with double-glycine peptidase domain
MALAYHGHPVAQEALRKELWLPDGTTNALKLVQSARAHGLKARGVEVPDQVLLTELPAGSIVHRKDKRFQVLEEIAGGRVTVLDPFDGRQTLPIDSFWAGFSKVALLFE